MEAQFFSSYPCLHCLVSVESRHKTNEDWLPLSANRPHTDSLVFQLNNNCSAQYLLSVYPPYPRKTICEACRDISTFVLLIGGSNFYENHRENQLRMAGSGTIPRSSSVASPLVIRMGSKAGAQSNGFPATIGVDDPVVSFNHDPLMSYGGTPPYDPGDNPAYNFVWQTVEELGLGSSSNPLDDLINAGDTVLIKTNWVDFGPAVYTRPEVVRPLMTGRSLFEYQQPFLIARFSGKFNLLPK